MPGERGWVKAGRCELPIPDIYVNWDIDRLETSLVEMFAHEEGDEE